MRNSFFKFMISFINFKSLMNRFLNGQKKFSELKAENYLVWFYIWYIVCILITYKRHVSPELQSVSEKHIWGKPMFSDWTKLALNKQQRDKRIKLIVMSVVLRRSNLTLIYYNNQSSSYHCHAKQVHNLPFNLQPRF